MVTIVKRSTNFTVAAQVNSKCATEVTNVTIELSKSLNSLAHTITADNGKEFAYHEQVSKALDTEVY